MIKEELKRGIIAENPILVLALGLCPALAVSTSLQNGLGMGCAATFVLICSNIIISLIKKWIPEKVRIPCYIVIIATFVTIVELTLKAYFPELNNQLGIFVPLIVVNCVILGRAEAFASKNNLGRSIIDGFVMGLGFTLALCILAIIREVLGSNKLWGLKVFPGFRPMTIFILAPGGFFTIAFVMAMINYFRQKKEGGQS
ncbi:MAG: RnfABCDGE type electron transport complex subunit E [Chitinivibrionales bacterium]|nr:RnfABCDGE type electron transport complex subunit E [Chitinivibrionales bacterium]